MAKSKKIDKDMGFRLKKARLDQKLTYDELSERDLRSPFRTQRFADCITNA